jgi:hypothetical protein
MQVGDRDNFTTDNVRANLQIRLKRSAGVVSGAIVDKHNFE